MGQKSKIEWTDATWNPVTGCTKVSTGCKHCYAERLFPRVYGKDAVRDVSMSTLRGELVERRRRFTDVKLHHERLEQPLHWKKPRMIFVNSMSDLFHEDVPFHFIDDIFFTMRKAGQHIFQILTKRPERMLEWCDSTNGRHDDLLGGYGGHGIPNVWLGISCENQATADERIPILLQVPAAVRFLSCEPLLDGIMLPSLCYHSHRIQGHRKIDWVIVGGESGPEYRPMKPEWAKSIIEQCKAARVPVFMKQMAGKKEIPDDLIIREYPDNRNISKVT